MYARGAPVVDIWAGHTTLRAWTPETRTVMFSVSKGVTTVCLLMAAEQGLIDLDAPVAQYWPESAENGKEATTVRQLLPHRAGLDAGQRDVGDGVVENHHQLRRGDHAALDGLYGRVRSPPIRGQTVRGTVRSRRRRHPDRAGRQW
ncbi:serine hydrolase domain-containing protein [Streptomyces sp. NPDC057474]|uniref:serine hydrolase domain-containing protein n=1 Tax=Streptomyces sp. NPDC057474 TaxID=3346144 RepID=UPI0036C673C0